MEVGFTWRSTKGTRAAENWDFGGIGLRSAAVMCVVLDGATSGPAGGMLARYIAHDLIDWFVGTDSAATADALIEQLRHIHAQRSPQFRFDSASFVIAIAEDAGTVLTLHAGDCLAGQREGVADIAWLMRPHTLINAIDDMPIEDIARSPLRNRITRSFRSREFMVPEISELTLAADETLVLATDGFWSALDAENQARFLAGDNLRLADDHDDCSALELAFVGGAQELRISGAAAENFYVATSR